MLFRRLVPLLLLSCSAHAAGISNIGVEFFGPGTKAEMITLEQAIEMALQNNLDAKFEHVGIAVEEARRRSAAGQFDPTLNASAIRESIRRPENATDFTSTDQVRQAAQVVAINNQTAAIIANTASNNANTQTANANLATQLALIAANKGDVSQASQDLATASSTLNQVTQELLNASGATPASTVFLNNTIFDQQNDRLGTSLQGRTPWGMRYGFGVEANKLRNTFSGDVRTIFPEYQTSATVTIIQPLLKNFGPAANLAELRIARINKKTQILTWKQRVSTTVQNVISTYYDMLYAMRDVDVKDDAIAAGEKLLAQNMRRLELGFMSPIDVRQAQVAVSTDREALLISKGFFMERQFALKRLILSEFQAGDHRIFVPLTAPRLPVPKIDHAELMQTALARRYDYQSALLDAEVQDVRLRFARNQLWPQVDLVATYGFNGLFAGYGEAFGNIFDGSPAWSGGIQVQIPLGSVKERAQLNLVKGLKEQSVLKIKQTELNVGVDVDTVISRILINNQRVGTAKETRELNEEAVRIAYKRLEEGQISSFDVIEQQRKLYDAKSRELASIAELNKSISQLWLATGTILDRQGVYFDK